MQTVQQQLEVQVVARLPPRHRLKAVLLQVGWALARAPQVSAVTPSAVRAAPAVARVLSSPGETAETTPRFHRVPMETVMQALEGATTRPVKAVVPAARLTAERGRPQAGAIAIANCLT